MSELRRASDPLAPGIDLPWCCRSWILEQGRLEAGRNRPPGDAPAAAERGGRPEAQPPAAPRPAAR